MEKYLVGIIIFLGASALILFVMNRNLSERNVALQTALTQQNALLQETQAELEKRDAVISQRDAQLADLEKRTQKAEGRYAQLVRTSQAVKDWDVVLLPADVNELLKARDTDNSDRASGNSNAGSGNP